MMIITTIKIRERKDNILDNLKGDPYLFIDGTPVVFFRHSDIRNESKEKKELSINIHKIGTATYCANREITIKVLEDGSKLVEEFINFYENKKDKLYAVPVFDVEDYDGEVRIFPRLKYINIVYDGPKKDFNYNHDYIRDCNVIVKYDNNIEEKIKEDLFLKTFDLFLKNYILSQNEYILKEIVKMKDLYTFSTIAAHIGCPKGHRGESGQSSVKGVKVEAKDPRGPEYDE